MINTKGIVLRTLKYRETSLIVDILTEELGYRSYLINGVRKAKSSQSAAILQPMNHLELMVYDQKDAQKLNRIKEFKLLRYYEKIPFEVLRSLMGQFMVELIRKCIRDYDPNKALYHFIEDWFRFLDRTENSLANLLLSFLIQFAGQLGFSMNHDDKFNIIYFDLQEGVFCQEKPDHRYFMNSELSTILNRLIFSMKEKAHEVKINSTQRSSLLDQLIVFYKLHIDGFGELKTLQVLRDIMR